MGTIESLWVLVEDKDGDIHPATRLESLSKLLPMIQHEHRKNEAAVTKEWIKHHPKDEWVVWHNELADLIQLGQNILNGKQP